MFSCSNEEQTKEITVITHIAMIALFYGLELDKCDGTNITEKICNCPPYAGDSSLTSSRGTLWVIGDNMRTFFKKSSCCTA